MRADWLVPEWAVAGAAGVMTTRHGGFSAAPFDSMNVGVASGDNPGAVQRNRRLLAETAGVEPVYLEQVHGARAIRLGRDDAAPGAPVHRADGSVTTSFGLACTAQVADCLPVLFAAPAGVGAAHAGWRGLAAGILEATLDLLCEAARCRPADVHAWLGACIGPRRFEVGPDVLDAFGVDPNASTLDFFRPHAASKWMADLPGLARARLLGRGVRHVSGGRWCTVEDESRFFSFRRDRVTGRMVAAVWRQP